jgi:hypothetical protein
MCVRIRWPLSIMHRLVHPHGTRNKIKLTVVFNVTLAAWARRTSSSNPFIQGTGLPHVHIVPYLL